MNAGSKVKPLTTQENLQSIEGAKDQIVQIDELIEDLQSGKSVDINKILNLSSAHPELLMLIGDVDNLTQRLRELRGLDRENLRSSLSEMIMNSTEVYESGELIGIPKVSSDRAPGVKTYAQYITYAKQ